MLLHAIDKSIGSEKNDSIIAYAGCILDIQPTLTGNGFLLKPSPCDIM